MSDLSARETLLLVCWWLITRGREDRCSVCESEFETPVEVFLLNPTLIIQRTLLIFSDGHHILGVIISWGETNRWASSHWTHSSISPSDHKANGWKRQHFVAWLFLYSSMRHIQWYPSVEIWVWSIVVANKIGMIRLSGLPAGCKWYGEVQVTSHHENPNHICPLPH